ncbi:MAG: sugar ABC transporter permease [Lachnospiraceae bacterium]|nr:sugar ABC transporter permease [Lachnospiraceae bacterium]
MKRNQKLAYLFITPSLLILIVFVFVPLFSAFFISLTNMDIYMNEYHWIGFENYKRMLEDSRVWNATKNTIVYTVAEVPLQIFLSLLLLFLMLGNTRFHKLLRTVFYLPYVCSMTAISIMWSMILNKNSGMVAYLLAKIGIQIPNLLATEGYAMGTVVAVSVWKNFGYTLTLLTAAALGVSSSLYEAAEIDGAGWAARFLHVTIPAIRQTILFCLVTTLITALQVFDQIYVLTQGGPLFSTETLVGYIFERGFRAAPFDVGYATSVAVYLFFLIAVLTFILRRYTTRREEEE